MRTLFRLFIALPLLILIWGFSNTIGATTTASQLLGVKDMSTWEIPGLKALIEAREQAGGLADEAKAEARRAAVKALKQEVSRRYGPEAAALIPNDLTLKEARHFDFDAFESLVADKLPDLDHGSQEAPPTSKVNYKSALRKLDRLPVKGRAPMTGYDRDQFGTAWSDAAGTFYWSRNGCDTRNDVLNRDLVDKTYKPGTGKCVVTHGTLRYENYTGRRNVIFDSLDNDYATDLDIEHVVALGNAWVTGAQGLTAEKRAEIANDPLNLFAADPSSNRQKGDADFATWLPSNKSFRAEYAARQIAVKTKYGLWVTPAEKTAMKAALTTAVGS